MTKHRKVYIALFMAYAAWMLWLLFDRPGYTSGIPYWEQAASHLNLMPLRTLKLFANLLTHRNPALVRVAVINLFGNVLLFIPLGFFLPLIWYQLRKLRKVLLYTGLIISFVELIQLVTLVGSCDIDDLILNLVGAALGYGIYKTINKKAAS